MKRPTLALACIMKNEAKNIPRLLNSVIHCFDEIHVTDTGSTDNSIQVLKDQCNGEKYPYPNDDGFIGYFNGAKVFLHYFQWVYDFSAARNYSFSKVTTDYVMWMDLDDTMGNKDLFILWRDNAMSLADYWLATYNYAYDKNNKVVCAFTRERVVRNNFGMSWTSFLHEGCVFDGTRTDVKVNAVNTWTVNHQRKIEDMKKDKKRNLELFEKNKDKMNSRLEFYYGKELFETGDTKNGMKILAKAAALPDQTPQDRVLAQQFCCHSALLESEKYKPNTTEYQQLHVNIINMAHQGLQLMPNRAEFHTIIGDAYLRLGQPMNALPYFHAAKNCEGVTLPDTPGQSVVFNDPRVYQEYPRNQIVQILYTTGHFERALNEAKECQAIYHDPQSKIWIEEIEKNMKLAVIPSNPIEVDEIVITCPPNANAYEWDEGKYKTKGMGGSETAAIEMAKHLRSLTGLPVTIFNIREDEYFSDSGVKYRSIKKLNEYFSTYKPKVHISWRHNIKVTDATTYLWAHDLVTPMSEQYNVYEKMLCLTPFHKNYTRAISGVPENKIQVTRNGIEPLKFKGPGVTKNPNKIIFPSSPDRGLDRCMRILDRVREEFPDIELHVFYGFDNLYKYGLGEMADQLQEMISERPWVKAHGFTQQDVLAQHMKESVIWLHPANFIETFCITALEALCSGTYPVTRRLGALQDTMKEAESNGMATVLDYDCVTDEEYGIWAEATKQALREKAWERVKVDPDKYSWKSVASEWIDFMGLPRVDRGTPLDLGSGFSEGILKKAHSPTFEACPI